jgi:hypothetical protein
VLHACNWAAADWLEGRGLLAYSRQELLEHVLLLVGPESTDIAQLQWLAGSKGDKVQWTPELRSALEEVLDNERDEDNYESSRSHCAFSAPGRVRWLSELVVALTEAQAGGAVAGRSLAAEL